MSAHLLLAAVGNVTNDMTNAAAALDGITSVKTSLSDWIVQGGIMMIPIILCSIIALAIILERAVYLRRIRLDTRSFTEKLTRVLRANMLLEAEVISENTGTPMAKIAHTALLSRDKPGEEIRLAVEETAGQESRALERYLPALGTIGSISPLLGLLGTVLGMIKSSNFLAISGTANPVGLIGGISEALITTAAGLFVAIPAVVCHSWFTNKINGLLLEMEGETNTILALLARDKTPAAKAVTSSSAARTRINRSPGSAPRRAAEPKE